MEPVRPIPVRPFQKTKSSKPSSALDEKPLRQSRSTADIQSLSRTSSFLSFTGLDTIKSSALFGIFEKGGYDNEPQTPELSKLYDFNLADPPTPEDPHELRASLMLGGFKLLAIGIVAFLFISLFNRIPNTNKFCAISSEEATDPFLYSVTAILIAFTFSFADRSLVPIIPAARDMMEPITRPNSVTNQPSRASRAHQMDQPINAWSFNVVLRYFAGFLGLAYAGTKLDFSQSSQFNICVATVAACALGVLDRTLRGALLSVCLGTALSAGYIYLKDISTDDMVGVFVLIWLNVTIYGSLGKILQVSDRP